MGEKTFNLTWNNHLANLSGLFEGLYKSGSLTDTTLACQGGMLRAHRLVLAACSPYFERVFKEHYGEQPILILRGVTVEEMECLLDFMYRGSINVSEEHLPSLIKTATDLEIRGLSGDQRNEMGNVYSRIENRAQSSETRLQMDYRNHVSFLQKPTDAVIGEIKMEEIEVEDDPMIMESNEDSLEAPLPLAKESTRHRPPQMFKPRTTNTRSTPSEDSFDNDLEKSEDPTVPAIQMNEDSMDPGRSVATSEVQNSLEIGKKVEIKQEEDKSSVSPPKDTKKALKSSKAQYKPFPCDLCTLAFTRASHLARHRRVHTGERPFGCTLCPRMFARQDKLKQHLDSHLQWPKRKGLSMNLTPQQQQQQQLSLLARGKRGRPRKASMEQSVMEEILKFGEFSSLLNKSSCPSNKPGKRVDFDLSTRNDEIEDLRKNNQLQNGASAD